MKLLSTLFFNLLILIFAEAQTFPTIQWEYSVGAPAFGSAAAADLDGDGYLEIVFTTYTNDGQAHCLNAEDGSINWVYDIGGCGDVAPLIYDMDNDDTLDVVINGSCNPTAFCINGHTGTLKWSTPSGGGDSPPTVADIDQDSMPEVLFGNFSGQVRVLNGEDGSLAKSIQVDNGPIQTEPTLCDVDGDGDLDFIVCNHFNNTGFYTYAYDYASGDTIWMNYHFDTSSTYYSYHGGAVADIDLDGKDEYVIGSNDGAIRALNVEDGSVLWRVTGLTNVIGALSIADMDGDDTLEVIYNNNDYINFNDHIGILNGVDGSLEWSHPITFSGFRGMAISDINGNGQLDMISGHFMGEFMAVEAYNGELWNIDLEDEFPQTFPYFDVDHGPLIADFDKDDTLEVFTVAGYGTYTPDSLNDGRAFLLNAGVGNCPSWLMFRQNVHRTAYLPNTEIDEWCDTSSNVSVLPILSELTVEVFPNPFQNELTFQLQLDRTTDVDLQIFDAQGKLLEHIQYAKMPVGFQQIMYTSIDLAAGLYFYHLRTEDGQWTGKLIHQP